MFLYSFLSPHPPQSFYNDPVSIMKKYLDIFSFLPFKWILALNINKNDYIGYRMPTRSDFILCSSLWLSSSVAGYGHQPPCSSGPLWGGVGRVRAAADTWSEGGGREQRMKSPGTKRKVKREDGCEVGLLKIPSHFKWQKNWFFKTCFWSIYIFKYQLYSTNSFLLVFLGYCPISSLLTFQVLQICISSFS